MKTQIENTMVLTDRSATDSLIADEFNFILEGCLSSKNEFELSDYFSTCNLLRFKKGFGSNHFWVCQLGETKRILFIDFKNQ